MQGTVKWFDQSKGYGFIAGNDGNDYFAHWREIVGTGYRNLAQGQTVEFTVVTDTKGLKAVDITVLNDGPERVYGG